MIRSADSAPRRPSLSSLLLLAAGLALCVGSIVPAAADEAPGQVLFVAEKCNTCHGVAAVSIEAKIKSPRMAGPDLSGYTTDDPTTVIAYLRKEAELDGVMHKRETKASDEDLQTMLDWLAGLAAPESEAPAGAAR
ncbi:MAG: c-type cytochrome [Acidobacteriota bacterium]